MALITAYRKDTGEKVRIPAHFLTHPTLSAPFTENPPADIPQEEARVEHTAPPAQTPKPIKKSASPDTKE